MPLDDPFAPLPAKLDATDYGQALMAHSRLLLICGPSLDSLQEYTGELLSWLKDHHPGLQLEPLLSLDGEQVIQRFNEMLADLSVEAAVRPDTIFGPERIWVLQDQGQLHEQEVRLLAKLQQQFPAARLSSIVLTTQPDRFAALLNSDERGLLSWYLPGAVPAQRPSPVQAPSPAPASSPVRKAPAPWTAPAPAPAAAGPKRGKKPTAPQKNKGKPGRTKKILMGALMGFVTSTTLVVAGLLWLHSQNQLDKLASLLGMDRLAQIARTNTPASPAAPAGSEAPQDTNTASAAGATPGANPGASSGAAAEGAVTPATPQTPPGDTAASTATPPANGAAPAEATPAAAPVPAPRPADGKEPAPAAPRTTPTLSAALKNGQAWVVKLPAESYLVNHGSFEQQAQAEQFIRRREYLANARLLPLAAEAGQPPKVRVVTGPFQNEARARSYMTRLELKDASALKVENWSKP